MFGICLDKVSKVALSLIFSVSSFGFKIHESVFFFDGIVKSLKCIALFLWGRILHVNVNIFCSHVNRQNGCTYSLHFSKSVFTSVCIHEQCRIDNKFFSYSKQPQLSGNLSYKLKFSSDKSHRLKAELSYSEEKSFRIIV